jgi:hypothetical protein
MCVSETISKQIMDIIHFSNEFTRGKSNSEKNMRLKMVLLGGIEPLSGNSALNYPLSLTNFVQSVEKRSRAAFRAITGA